MSFEWSILPLGEVLTLQRGHDLPTQNRLPGNIPIIGSSGITGFHNIAKAKGPGVTVGRSGNSMGEISYSEKDYWPLNTALYVTNFKGNDPKFVSYLLSTIDFDQFNSGSAQKSLNRNAVYPFEVRIPTCIKDQQRISAVLSSLEDKLSSNHQINQTLEQIAQAIFKSWFVDFEPVKAKIAAKEQWVAMQPVAEPSSPVCCAGTDEPLPDLDTWMNLAAMQAISGKTQEELNRFETEQPEQYAELRATAELFPSALQESELGGIPEGWMAPKFDELVTAKQGKYLAKDKMAESQSEDHPIPVWGGNGILGYTKDASYQNPIVLMTCRGSNCGLIRHTASKAWVSNNSFGCIPKIGSTWFLLTYFQASSFDDCVSGSAQPQITYSALKSKDLSYAVEEVICLRYSELIEPLYEKVLQSMEESSVLEHLRDKLIPKLLSGELSIPLAMEGVEDE